MLPVLLLALGGAAGCDGGDDTGSGGTGGSATGGTGGTGGGTGGSATGGTGGVGGTGGSATGGTGGSEVTCTQARADALGPVDKVSTGEVTVLDDQAGEVFIDASAGGVMAQKDNPWIYIALGTKTRVDVTDVSADASDAWDVAIKRPILRANNGDGGPAGKGGALHIDKDFDDVTEADAQGASFLAEDWFDDECNLATDQTGAIKTSFDGWYLYENMTVLPAPGTWLVRGGDGTSVHKLSILNYYANPDGSPGMAGGRYVVRIGTLVQ